MDADHPPDSASDGKSPVAVNAIVAFTFAVLLVTLAAWPKPSGLTPDAASIPDEIDVAAMTTNRVGQQVYQGPETGHTIREACAPAQGADAQPCYVENLKKLLAGRGASPAFEALESLLSQDLALSGQGHAMAHDLGRYAYEAYGSIQEALQNCSFKAFQGCFHGALQNYMDDLPEVQGSDLVDLCPKGDAFRESTCVHGIGHGLMLYTNANVNRSLGLCDALRDNYQQSSCWSGVIMENLVGYYEMQSGEGHAHSGHSDPPGYMVSRPGDPYYPCSVLADKYKPTCWQQQADYILYQNESDFRDAAEKCDQAPGGFAAECRRSLGRDASGWYRDVGRAVEYCGYGDPVGRPPCIRGIASEVVLYHFDPLPGLQACRAMPDQDKSPCYNEVGLQGRSMLGLDRMAAVCAAAEESYVGDCRAGAGLA